jgi:hypothetical protein
VFSVRVLCVLVPSVLARDHALPEVSDVCMLNMQENIMLRAHNVLNTRKCIGTARVQLICGCFARDCCLPSLSGLRCDMLTSASSLEGLLLASHQVSICTCTRAGRRASSSTTITYLHNDVTKHLLIPVTAETAITVCITLYLPLLRMHAHYCACLQAIYFHSTAVCGTRQLQMLAHSHSRRHVPSPPLSWMYCT